MMIPPSGGALADVRIWYGLEFVKALTMAGTTRNDCGCTLKSTRIKGRDVAKELLVKW